MHPTCGQSVMFGARRGLSATSALWLELKPATTTPDRGCSPVRSDTPRRPAWQPITGLRSWPSPTCGSGTGKQTYKLGGAPAIRICRGAAHRRVAAAGVRTKTRTRPKPLTCNGETNGCSRLTAVLRARFAGRPPLPNADIDCSRAPPPRKLWARGRRPPRTASEAAAPTAQPPSPAVVADLRFATRQPPPHLLL